jgi:hypothetical protein
MAIDLRLLCPIPDDCYPTEEDVRNLAYELRYENIDFNESSVLHIATLLEKMADLINELVILSEKKREPLQLYMEVKTDDKGTYPVFNYKGRGEETDLEMVNRALQYFRNQTA